MYETQCRPVNYGTGKEQVGFDGEKLGGKAIRWAGQKEKGMQKMEKKNRIESRARLLDKQGGMGV